MPSALVSRKTSKEPTVSAIKWHRESDFEFGNFTGLRMRKRQIDNISGYLLCKLTKPETKSLLNVVTNIVLGERKHSLMTNLQTAKEKYCIRT